jgi:hypothetical protein
MRVVWNIVENTENSIKEIISAMRLINELSEHTKDIYAFLSDENSTIKSGASEEQIAEERKKAKLIKDDDKWEEELIIAEKHPYFSGQIYFLLHIEDKDLQEFILYRDKAINVFKENLGHNDNYYFHRALLALAMDHGDSDYFIKKSNKYSFCEKEDIKNNMLRYRKNNEGKFYYDLIKSLLLDVVQSPKTADEDIEKKATRVEINDKKWQTFFITTPHCFDYCKQKLIKWDDEQTIYLISKLQMSSKHVELRTYYLWKEWIIKQKGQLDPFKSAWYYDRSEYPCAVLDLFDYEETRFKLDIFFQDGCYQFILKSSDNKANDKLLEIKEKLKNSIEIEGNNECLEFPSCSTVEKAKKQIEEICELLKQI